MSWFTLLGHGGEGKSPLPIFATSIGMLFLSQVDSVIKSAIQKLWLRENRAPHSRWW